MDLLKTLFILVLATPSSVLRSIINQMCQQMATIKQKIIHLLFLCKLLGKYKMIIMIIFNSAQHKKMTGNEKIAKNRNRNKIAKAKKIVKHK